MVAPESRQRARIPPTERFQEKWRLAFTLVRQVRAASLEVTSVLGDAEFGDTTTLGPALYRLHLPYALGVASTLTGYRGTPRASRPAAEGFRLDRCRRAARELCRLLS